MNCLLQAQASLARYSMAIQRPGETIVMQRNVAHCVLTVSGIPGLGAEGVVGAALLSSTVSSEGLSTLERTRETEWLLPTGKTEGSAKVPGAPKKEEASEEVRQSGAKKRRNKW